jgi:hypothetical protein
MFGRPTVTKKKDGQRVEMYFATMGLAYRFA